ncbi:hypothetical protein [Phreatobacter stygius]|uniref:Uncharacterized protein n=1 Tax=Phreatobacter stygius TaxID=1940610 RepID=A0A4D7B0R5_9HYPH|nr:hypothetical protein [Phreatobacter stygius]QCI67234.1 hypothetical protein E8M01_25170 [Phreatobacter stygius]
MADVPPGRSFSAADRIVMRAIYRRCCADLGLAGGTSSRHQALARTIMQHYVAGATDPERLAALALGEARKAARRATARPRTPWASLMALLGWLQPRQA